MCVFIELFTRNLLFIDDRIWIIFQFQSFLIISDFSLPWSLFFFHSWRAHDAPAMIIMTVVTIKTVFSLVYAESVNFFSYFESMSMFNIRLILRVILNRLWVFFTLVMTTAFVNDVFFQSFNFFLKKIVVAWLRKIWRQIERHVIIWFKMSSSLTNWLGKPLHGHYNYQSESHLNGSDLVDYKLYISSHLILVYCLIFNPKSKLWKVDESGFYIKIEICSLEILRFDCNILKMSRFLQWTVES